MTRRNPNRCFDCNYEWYPRGKARSLRCPNCSSSRVGVRTEYHKVNRTMRRWGMILTAGGAIMWLSGGLAIGFPIAVLGVALWYFCGTDMYTWMWFPVRMGVSSIIFRHDTGRHSWHNVTCCVIGYHGRWWIWFLPTFPLHWPQIKPYSYSWTCTLIGLIVVLVSGRVIVVTLWVLSVALITW